MASASTSGSLRIEVIEARLTRDTEFFSKMDPYCVIESRMQKFKTRTLQGAGKTPRWNQAFDFDVKYIGDDIFIKVFDEDVAASDLVGEATYKISSLCVGNGIDEWFPIQFKGKQSGQVHLKSTWKPGNKANKAVGQMAAGFV
mmetsp:Transcript_3654/g.4882  ORF Transcript_3654/g.4882 Transcript_3654/m.4882 type:complete len:143 (+) Transcript_3654:24-452(+)